MSKFCTHTPCDQLMEALGFYILGDSEGNYRISALALPEYVPQLPLISYCPFCGTRLEELSLVSDGPVQINGE